MSLKPLTPQAHQEMQAKLKHLTEERVLVMARLKVAREMGDLSENGAYTYAKFELGSISRQMRQLRHILETSQVVAVQSHYSQVEFGCHVVLEHKNKQTTYQIVSLNESNPLEHKLSIESPLGQALMGKKVGDTVIVNAPVGDLTYLIVSIK